MPDLDNPDLELTHQLHQIAQTAFQAANGHDPEPAQEPELVPASALAAVPDHYPSVLVPPRRVYEPGAALPPHLTLPEIAKACRTKHANIWRECCWHGSMPYCKQGGRLFVETPDAISFINKGWSSRRHRRTAAEIAAAAVVKAATEPRPPAPPEPPAPAQVVPLEPHRQAQLRLVAINEQIPRLVGRGWLMANLDMDADEADAFLDSGELPVFRLGDQRKVAVADLIALIERSRE